VEQGSGTSSASILSFHLKERGIKSGMLDLPNMFRTPWELQLADDALKYEGLQTQVAQNPAGFSAARNEAAVIHDTVNSFQISRQSQRVHSWDDVVVEVVRDTGEVEFDFLWPPCCLS
jgi:hypothetical protein